MDTATLIGIVIAFGAIIGGDLLEGGHVSAILQPTAAIIVLGGTLGAVVLQFPAKVLITTWRALKQIFLPHKIDTAATVAMIMKLAEKARREGLVSLDDDASDIADPFLRRAVELAVDGTDGRALRAALELEVSRTEEVGEGPHKVLEACGGYAPTVGILGAVLGLIHVMENLSDPSKLGGGIATAFVATVYGVGTANLLFLPMAGKLKARHRERIVLMELIVEGAVALADGENPRLIERRLSVYVADRVRGASADDARQHARMLRAV